VQLFGAAGLHSPMLLHRALVPLMSIGHVVSTFGVHVWMHTWKPELAYEWHIIDAHCVLSVHGSKTAPVHAAAAS